MKLLTLAFALFSMTAYAQSDSVATRIAPEQAKDNIGRFKTVCGNVSNVVYTSGQGNPVYLNFSKDYPYQPFAAVVWGEDAKAIKIEPLVLVRSRQVCVTGMVTDYKGRPQIIIKKEGQLEVQ